MNNNSTNETKKNKPALTLRQLENHTLVTNKAEMTPATLYQVAYRVFDERVEPAIEAAQSGDFSQIDKLRSEIVTLVKNFIQHESFIRNQKAIIKDPDGPEARREKELMEYAEFFCNKQRAEAR